MSVLAECRDCGETYFVDDDDPGCPACRRDRRIGWASDLRPSERYL